MKNVIILHADQQRFDSLSCNGAKIPHTPNIDALAKDGCNFTSHYSSNPVCSPSRASLLTGLTVTGHGVVLNGYPLFDCTKTAHIDEFSLKIAKERNGGSALKEKIPTLADVFAENGYDTALFGKLHLQPTKASKEFGYDESCNTWLDKSHDDWYGPLCGFRHVRLCSQHNTINNQLYHGGHYAKFLYEKHRDVYDALLKKEGVTGRSETKGDIYINRLPKELTTSMWVADEFVDYMEQRDKNKPFFAFVGFPDPHHPFTPSYDYAKNYLDADVQGGKRLSEDQYAKKSTHVRSFIDANSQTEKDIVLAQRYTLAMEKNIDDGVGRIVGYLKENRLYDDTILIFTTDHGDFLGDYGCLYKHTAPLNCLVHTPLIIKPNKGRSLPKEFKNCVANYDVFPTLLEMTGVKSSCYLQGQDIFSENYRCVPYIACYNLDPQDLALAVVDGEYKYTFYPNTGEEELYNVKADPSEMQNLVFEEGFSELKRKMKEMLLLKHASYDTRRYGAHAIW